MSWEQEFADLQVEVESIRARIGSQAPRGPLRVPCSAEFVTSPEYLGSTLFPRQATLLKVVFLESESLTDYDRAVSAEWQSGFVDGGHDDLFDGSWYEPAPDRELTIGTAPDVDARMSLLRARGRRWFRHLNLPAGRRAGKGDLTAKAVLFVVWHLLAAHEPQPMVNAARGKTLTVDIFAGNHQQARENVFTDIVKAVVRSKCFAPYIRSLTQDRLVLATPFDLTDPDRVGDGTIHIVARNTTVLSGRGQTSVIQVYDEMAWVDTATSKAPADDLFASATPALDQARGWAFIVSASSPHYRTGKFYGIHRQCLEIDEDTGTAAYPEMITFQFASWSPYLDATIATTIPLTSEPAARSSEWLRGDNGEVRCFPDPGGAPVVDNEELRQKQREDSVRFHTETGGQWADVADSLLYPRWVDRIFQSVGNTEFTKRHAGVLRRDYVMHIDPSTSKDPTAYLIGHTQVIDDSRYAVFDCLRRWRPDGADLDWDVIFDQIEADIRAFQPVRVTVDQHGGTFVVTELKKRLRKRPLRHRITIEHISQTRTSNIAMTDIFRDAVKHGRVRSFYDRQLDLELRFLRDDNGSARAPETGPVTTDDVAICAIVVVDHLLGDNSEVHEELSNFQSSAHPGRPSTDQSLFDRLSAANNQSWRTAESEPRINTHRRR